MDFDFLATGNVILVAFLGCIAVLLEEKLCVTRALSKVALDNISVICGIVVLTLNCFPSDTHSGNWSLYCHILWSFGAWDPSHVVPRQTTL